MPAAGQLDRQEAEGQRLHPLQVIPEHGGDRILLRERHVAAAATPTTRNTTFRGILIYVLRPSSLDADDRAESRRFAAFLRVIHVHADARL